VLAIDLSPEMVDVARRRSRDLSNIEYVVADATAVDLPRASFDCVASLGATVVTHILAARPEVRPRRQLTRLAAARTSRAGPGPPELPHDADGPAARMEDVICGAQEHGSAVVCLSGCVHR